MANIDLKIEGLKKHFGGVRAVDGISVRIQGNELIGLIGPNGSGKTTTMDKIAARHQAARHAAGGTRR